MECEYCNKILSTTSTLNYHKKNNKACLKLRGIQNDKTSVISCKYCKKTFSKKNISRHITTCEDKTIKEKNDAIKEKNDAIKEKNDAIKEKNDEIREKDELIRSLQIKLEIYKQDHEIVHEMAKQPKTTTTNNNNKYLILSPFNLTQDEINSIVEEKFTKEHFLNGQRGVARFADTNILKDADGNQTYMCSDPSRYIFNYKNKDGELEKDMNATKLTDSISPAVIKKSEKICKEIIPRNDKIMNTEYKNTLLEIKSLPSNNKKFANELSIITHNTSSLVIDDGNNFIIEDYTDDEADNENFLREQKRNTNNDPLLYAKEFQESCDRIMSVIDKPKLYNYYLRRHNDKFNIRTSLM